MSRIVRIRFHCFIKICKCIFKTVQLSIQSSNEHIHGVNVRVFFGYCLEDLNCTPKPVGCSQSCALFKRLFTGSYIQYLPIFGVHLHWFLCRLMNVFAIYCFIMDTSQMLRQIIYFNTRAANRAFCESSFLFHILLIIVIAIAIGICNLMKSTVSSNHTFFYKVSL